jgi:exodeoxyribonuclease V alpha subunit
VKVSLTALIAASFCQSTSSLTGQLSNALSQGDSCIEINKEEQSIVLASGMADNSGKFPVVLESNKLYLQRYWSYECQ